MSLILDIETVGFDLHNLAESQQEFLLRYAEREIDNNIKKERIEETERYLSLYPFTARIVAIGLLNTKTECMQVLFNSDIEEQWEVGDKKIKYLGKSETEILKLFWSYVLKTDKIITFNGRIFDIPFIMLRSAILGIEPTINLMHSRYNLTKHIDLRDQFTFYGILRRFNLDFYCYGFGIKSPKSKGITGMEIKQLYKAGKIKDIAVYCGEDVKATFELYKIWDQYLNL